LLTMNREPKLLKAYAKMTESKTPIQYDDDKAVTEFRGFNGVGELYIERTSHPDAIDVLIAVTENLRNRALARKGMLA